MHGFEEQVYHEVTYHFFKIWMQLNPQILRMCSLPLKTIVQHQQ